MLKSVAVVIGSYLLSIVLVMASGPLLRVLFPDDFATGHIPSTLPLIVSTAFFSLISFVCAGVCARFSPLPAQRQVLWFFLLGEVLGIGATIANWSNGWPHWYAVSWLIAWPLACWLGLEAARRGRAAA